MNLRRRRHRTLGLRNVLLAGITVCSLGSCSLVLEFDECRNNEDCSNIAGAALVCNLDTQTCEERPDPSEVACEDNVTCTDIFSEDEAEIQRFFDGIEAGTVYANRRAGATAGAWPGVNPFGGWKGSASSSVGAGGSYYLQQFMREQSRVRVF